MEEQMTDNDLNYSRELRGRIARFRIVAGEVRDQQAADYINGLIDVLEVLAFQIEAHGPKGSALPVRPE